MVTRRIRNSFTCLLDFLFPAKFQHWQKTPMAEIPNTVFHRGYRSRGSQPGKHSPHYGRAPGCRRFQQSTREMVGKICPPIEDNTSAVIKAPANTAMKTSLILATGC